MLAIDLILSYLNRKERIEEHERRRINKWCNLYFGMSLHTSGAVPAFADLSNKGLDIPAMGWGGNAEYSSYLSGLQSIGFDYNGFWIFPPNFQGWEYHFIFDKIIFSRHPREPEDIRMWRFSQYVPITQGPCGQLNEVVTGAIFQDSNYTVEMENKDDNAYIQSNNFSGYDLIGYVSNIAYKNIVEDANGFTVRIPKYSRTEQKSDKLEVDIWFINSKNIRYLPTSEDYIIFEKNGYGWYIDKKSIWRFAYDYKTKQYILADEDKKGYYLHDFGRLPITKAGGVWNTHGYYESYYYKAKPLMDDFCRTYSAAQLVDKEASHPFIIEPNVDCPECNGKGSMTIPCDGCPDGHTLVSCGSCHGSGSISRNPGQHVVMSKEDIRDGVDIKFVNPDVAVNKNLHETVRAMLDMILEVLHLNKQKTDTVQSGLAKAIDQERLYKFVSGISNDLFDKLIPDTLRDIAEYRNAKPESWKIVKPTQFQIKTAEDLLMEYKTASEASVPFYIRQKLMLDYIDKQYAGDSVLKRKAVYINAYDPVFVYTTDEKVQLATQKQLAYSKMISMWLDEVSEDMGNDAFVMATDEAITTKVEPLMTAYFTDNPEEETKPEPKIVDVNKQITEGG